MPAYSMSKSKRQGRAFNNKASFILKNSNPGVGSYKYKQNQERMQMWIRSSQIKTSPSSSIPKAKKFFNLPSTEIGPGTYNPEKLQTKIMVTIKGRSVTNLKAITPSSTTYNTQIKFPSKKYTFTKSRSRFKTQQSPSPTKYIISQTQNIPSTIFGRQQKNKIKNLDNPSSWNYHCNNSLTYGESFQYSFPKQKKFGYQKRQENIKKNVPGPGTYCINHFIKKYKGGKFAKEERLSITHQVGGPGPSTYYPKDLSQKTEPKPTIGYEKRQTLVHQNTPGPGTYHPNPQILIKKQQTASFPHADRLQFPFEQTPGPGTYSTKRLMQSKSFSISTRFFDKKNQKSPGPQDYNPEFKQIQEKTSNIIFGNEIRSPKIKKQLPGPGQYQFNINNYSKTFHFNKAQNTQKKLKSTPSIGPGEYKLKPFIGMYDGYQKNNKEILYV